MSVQPQTRRMGRFIDLWPHISVLSASVMLTALIASAFFGNTLISTTVQADEEEPATLGPIQLQQQPVGALRVDVLAVIPENQWVTYEIQILDRNNQPIATGIKQAWRETGTWSEEGESGTWDESDAQSSLDMRARQEELVTISIQVLDHTDTSGQAIDQPVPFEVTVHNGVVDGRYLWAGFLGSTILAMISRMAVSASGTVAIRKTIFDSDVGDRAVVGGSDRLVQVNVNINSDETSPKSLDVHLWIKDRSGEQLYEHSFPVQLSLTKEDGKVESATGNLNVFFLLEPRSSYGFYVEVMPDGPVDQTELSVRDGAKTLGIPKVIHLKSI